MCPVKENQVKNNENEVIIKMRCARQVILFLVITIPD